MCQEKKLRAESSSSRFKENLLKKFVLKGTIKNLNLPMQSVDYTDLAKRFPYLQDLPIKNYRQVKLTILIGLNQSHLLVAMEKRMGKENEPIAIRSKLGWPIFRNISYHNNTNHVMVVQEDEILRKMVDRYFTEETPEVKIVMKLPESAANIRAKKLITDTIKYENNKYEIGLLWINDSFKFPRSALVAGIRLRMMEKQLEKKPRS